MSLTAPLPGKSTTVRVATTADLASANELYQSTMGEGFQLDSTLWETVCTNTNNYRTIVAQDETGTVVGMAVVVVSDRIRLAAGTRRRRFHVDDLIVSPKKRRHGVGRSMLEYVKTAAEAEAPSYVLINCDFMNVAARRTYEAAGLHLARQGGDRFEISFSG